jgi:hypothetical protein
MSLQTIINHAETISINKRKTAGIQYTRSQIVRVSETTTRNPWRFTVKVARVFDYAQARALIETIDTLDRINPEIISFSDNANLSYMFAYQGEATTEQLAALEVYSFEGNQLLLDNLTTIANGTVVFKKGDIIQIENYPYPFTITANVVKSSSTITVPVHRANFISDAVANANVVVGNAVNFQMICINMPTYTLSPGGGSALVSWDSDFEMYEFTGDQV